jgi:hypothetical protein
MATQSTPSTSRAAGAPNAQSTPNNNDRQDDQESQSSQSRLNVTIIDATTDQYYRDQYEESRNLAVNEMAALELACLSQERPDPATAAQASRHLTAYKDNLQRYFDTKAIVDVSVEGHVKLIDEIAVTIDQMDAMRPDMQEVEGIDLTSTMKSVTRLVKTAGVQMYQAAERIYPADFFHPFLPYSESMQAHASKITNGNGRLPKFNGVDVPLWRQWWPIFYSEVHRYPIDVISWYDRYRILYGCVVGKAAILKVNVDQSAPKTSYYDLVNRLHAMYGKEYRSLQTLRDRLAKLEPSQHSFDAGIMFVHEVQSLVALIIDTGGNANDFSKEGCTRIMTNISPDLQSRFQRHMEKNHKSCDSSVRRLSCLVEFVRVQFSAYEQLKLANKAAQAVKPLDLHTMEVCAAGDTQGSVGNNPYEKPRDSQGSRGGNNNNQRGQNARGNGGFRGNNRGRGQTGGFQGGNNNRGRDRDRSRSHNRNPPAQGASGTQSGDQSVGYFGGNDDNREPPPDLPHCPFHLVKEDHLPKQCTQAIKYKMAACDKMHLCRNCLKNGHKTAECKWAPACTACEKPHNPVICTQSQSNQRPSGTPPAAGGNRGNSSGSYRGGYNSRGANNDRGRGRGRGNSRGGRGNPRGGSSGGSDSRSGSDQAMSAHSAYNQDPAGVNTTHKQEQE